MTEKTRKIIKIIIAVLFIAYCYLLFSLLFLRGGAGYIAQFGVFSKERFDAICNLIPLKTIILYFTAMKYGWINNGYALMNIYGNLIAFAPMGLFIPVLFGRKINRFWKFLLLLVCIILIVEIMQYVTALGSADIDDLLLNTAGGCLIYAITKIPIINKFIKELNPQPVPKK